MSLKAGSANPVWATTHKISTFGGSRI
ncbi:ash family protein [Candidatus Hamiltonella defensa]|nr:ash family protein [Candidatus Hamiltonella defensa]